jgi:hypothetical protein
MTARTRKAQSEQVETGRVTIEEIMGTAAFRRGVNDFRNGRPPAFDGPRADSWAYERGRLFAALAPRDMQVVSRRTKQLNPKAVAFYRRNNWEII